MTEKDQNLETIASEQPPFRPKFYSAKRDVAFHGLSLLFSVIVLGLSFYLQLNQSKQVIVPEMDAVLPPTCVSRIILGVNCPGCGMTRAFISVSHGAWCQAWKFNPSIVFMYPFLAVQIPWHAIQLWLILSHRRAFELKWVAAIPAIVVSGMLTVWVFRVLGLL
ncbi:MAG: DUF2752 domain-containing protein [Planctomycetota bacterium]